MHKVVSGILGYSIFMKALVKAFEGNEVFAPHYDLLATFVVVEKIYANNTIVKVFNRNNALYNIESGLRFAHHLSNE